MSAPEGARKGASFQAVCLDPDYCWTPAGKGKRLVPYMVACDLSESTACSPNVFFGSQAAFLHKNSLAPRVQGAEPACPDGGKNSGSRNGAMWVDEHSSTVTINGISAVRHGDMCWMNVKV
jgi:uncharacterized Zn-binding protein involved in type VI secretion